MNGFETYVKEIQHSIFARSNGLPETGTETTVHESSKCKERKCIGAANLARECGSKCLAIEIRE